MKKLVLLTLCFVMAAGAFVAGFPAGAAAESLYIRKIVSVVYDDSGSMSSGGSRDWAYASYAMQAFCGLMNEEDRLFITYMSDAETAVRQKTNLDPKEIDLSAAGIQRSVNAIRSHIAEYTTPYAAVDFAFNKLRSVHDDNKNTQYWLVIITDGAFGDAPAGVAGLDAALKQFTAQRMPNGATPQVTFMAIGNHTTIPTHNEDAGIHVYRSQGSSDIIDVMASIADKVSGRSKVSDSDMHLPDKRTIRITSAVPLINIAVLSQKTAATVTDAQTGAGVALNISRSVRMKYPENAKDGWKTDKSLNGGAFLINGGVGNIDAGTYDIHFDSDIDPGDVVVMFEPALEVRMTLSVNGVQLADPRDTGNLRQGDEISFGCKIFEIGTDKEISAALLPNGTQYSAVILEDGAAVKTAGAQDLRMGGHTLGDHQTEALASVTIPGFVPIQAGTGVFRPTKPVVYGLEVRQAAGLTLTSAQLRTNAEKITFVITADGVPVSRAVAQSLDFRLDNPPFGDIAMEADGSFSFTPKHPGDNNALRIGVNTVTGVLTAPNGTVISKDGAFTIPQINYEIAADPPGGLTLTMAQLKNNAARVTFAVTADGVPVTKAEAEALSFAITPTALGDQSVDKDGRFVFALKYPDDGAQLVIGENTVSGVLNGAIRRDVAVTVTESVYAVHADMPIGFTLTTSQLKTNTQKIAFTVEEDGVVITSKDKVLALGFGITAGSPGETVYAPDGRVTFMPRCAEDTPITGIRTGDISVTGALPNGAQATVTFHITPVTYVITPRAIGDNGILRHRFNDTTKTILFDIYVDGDRLDEQAVGKALETGALTCSMNAPYDKRLALDVAVNADGTLSLTPRFDKWAWFATYFIPKGELRLSAECGGGAGTGVLMITNDAMHELLFNLLIPLAALLFVLGHVFKKRFMYAARIYFNKDCGSKNAYHVTGSNRWDSRLLLSWTMLVPFLTDTKRIGGVRFYANGFMFGRASICVKTKRCPNYSGVVSEGVDYSRPVKFSTGDIEALRELIDDQWVGPKKRVLVSGNALVTSASRTYGACRVYLYITNKSR